MLFNAVMQVAAYCERNHFDFRGAIAAANTQFAPYSSLLLIYCLYSPWHSLSLTFLSLCLQRTILQLTFLFLCLQRTILQLTFLFLCLQRTILQLTPPRKTEIQTGTETIDRDRETQAHAEEEQRKRRAQRERESERRAQKDREVDRAVSDCSMWRQQCPVLIMWWQQCPDPVTGAVFKHKVELVIRLEITSIDGECSLVCGAAE